MVGNLLRTPQRQLIVGDEGGQWRAKLMRHVGIESLHLRVRFLDARQQCVELVDQRYQFKGLLAAIEPLVQAVHRQCARLTGQPSHGRQPEVHQGEAAKRNHDSSPDGSHEQSDCEPVQQLVVGLNVQRQLHPQNLRCRVCNLRHLELPLEPYRARSLVAGMSVEHDPIGLQHLKRQVSMSHQKIIELVAEIFRIAVLFTIRQEMPYDGFLLRERVLLPVAKIELGHQVDSQTDQPEPGKTLQRQPPG